jgi:RecA/RadA recombinase
MGAPSNSCSEPEKVGLFWLRKIEPSVYRKKGTHMTKSDLTETGIEGLDGIFLGGIPRANTILVQGQAGTGKTLIGLEFIYEGIAKFDEPGIVVVFESNPDKLIRDAALFGWDLGELQQQNKLKIIFTSPQVFESELRSPDSLLLETAARMGVRRIFIDGIGLLYPAANVGNAIGIGGCSGGAVFKSPLLFFENSAPAGDVGSAATLPKM